MIDNLKKIEGKLFSFSGQTVNYFTKQIKQEKVDLGDLKVYKKNPLQDKNQFFFEEENQQERDQKYSSSLFYRIYYSGDSDWLFYFKKIKNAMMNFGIKFQYKKRRDEGYLIILDEFIDNLMGSLYTIGDYDKAFDQFIKSFDDSSFIMQLHNDENWISFMSLMDKILGKYQEILNLPLNGSKPFDIKEEIEEKEMEQLMTKSQISDSEPIIRKKNQKEEKVATVGNKEEIEKFQKAEKNQKLKNINESDETVMQLFYQKYGKKLRDQNLNFYQNITICFDYLCNWKMTNDEIFNHLQNYLDQDFEAVLFMIDNREKMVEEINKAKEETRKQYSKNSQNNYSSISQNMIIKKKKKKKKDFQNNQDQILIKLGLKEGNDQIKKLQDNLYNVRRENMDEDNDEYNFLQTDFFRESNEKLQKKYRMKKNEGVYNVVFDVMPQMKSQLYRETKRLRIQEAFPDHLHKAFTDGEFLNNLQTIIYPSVYEKEENILCCAPTGAGKTNVALMSVLKLCREHYNPETRRVDEKFKIVYISPLKALATEIVRKFTKKLSYLGVKIKEFTGDMSLSKKEISETHLIVSTPEKWDVVTRKSEDLNMMMSLLIIDEIHLLDDERGRVLECLIARTNRLIQGKQCRIRLLGLSATLPNFKDVAKFMRVGRNGLFYFDESFRPVPLHKKFVGVKKLNQQLLKNSKDFHKMKEILKRNVTTKDIMNINAYDICVESLKKNQQVLVFVHSRKETVTLAEFFTLRASSLGESGLFIREGAQPHKLSRKMENRDLKMLVAKGIGSHNAGIKRKDRNIIEKAFIAGNLSVVVCTATLAWGVNMPCHTVIIKGTDFYDPSYGFKPISLLDVQQIFGRAGRPQYDQYGEAVLITYAEDLNYFISMLSYVKPIESKLKPYLYEAMLAEIVLGNISNVQECIEYLKSTFYYVRLRKNPAFYGVKNKQDSDVSLFNQIHEVLTVLHKNRLIRYDQRNSIVEATELGRICSHYYINTETMEKICDYLQIYSDEDEYQNVDYISEINLLGIIAQSSEFEQIQSKPEEEFELQKLKQTFNWIHVDEKYSFKYEVQEKGSRTISGLEKILLLIFGYLNRQQYDTWSLQADTNYIVQNTCRIMRCLLDIALRQNNMALTEKIIVWMRYLQNCVSEDQTPLRMFCYDNFRRSVKQLRNQAFEVNKFNFIPSKACEKLEWAQNYKETGYLFSDLSALRENLKLLRDIRLTPHQEKMIRNGIMAYPFIDLLYEIKPIARTILKIKLKIKIVANYNRNWHQRKEIFWVIASDRNEILHYSTVIYDMSRANTFNIEEGPSSDKNFYIEHNFFVPIRENAVCYTVKVMSNNFIESDAFCEVNLKELQLDFEKMEYTPLLDLRPLKIDVLQNQRFQNLYKKIKYFNPLQTQVFFPIYHTDENIIVGAPTGSGKTLMAELAILRVFKQSERKKVVYVAPYKALVRERVKDWKRRFGQILNKNVEEISGDYSPDVRTLIKSDLLVTTPEKWDGVSRSWLSRSYVQNVSLIIFDEIHLLGQERGPVIEVIVSRMNFIANQLKNKIRMVGLSTAMANASDMASWFGVKPPFMFNFSPNVRPIPVQIHFRGFNEKKYCPRMNSMNKPAFNDIKKFSNGLPVLIFVSSRRQTRLTANSLISMIANDYNNQGTFLKMNHEEIKVIISRVQDTNLKNSLSFGIGIHHAGLVTQDRMIVEELFEASKIQILVATSTLAWGVNFPAKLVIVKGTEFFDPKTKGYVDMPISDILQMIGRAGRPQYNDEGTACVYVEKSQKNFYRKYLNDPFPIESEFLSQISVHLNAEISSKTVKDKQQCIDYLTWTYFFKRIVRNPKFYGIQDREPKTIQNYLIDLVEQNLFELKQLKCITIEEDDFKIKPTFLGQTASLYYIMPETVNFMSKKLKKTLAIKKLIQILSNVEEYKEVPVRHNEGDLNMQLSKICPYKIDKSQSESPNVKTFLLYQAYFGNLPLPIRDYITDLKLVLDQSFRLIAAMIDICAHRNLFRNCIHLIHLIQMIVQGTWINHSIFYNIKGFNEDIIGGLKRKGVQYISQLVNLNKFGKLVEILKDFQIKEKTQNKIVNQINQIPDINMKVSLKKLENGKSISNYRFKSKDEVNIEIQLNRVNSSQSLDVKIKKLKKQKKYSWFLLVGNLKKDNIFAIKKLFLKRKTIKNVKIMLPELNLEKTNNLEIYLMSDSFIGLDQIQTIDLNSYITK